MIIKKFLICMIPIAVLSACSSSADTVDEYGNIIDLSSASVEQNPVFSDEKLYVTDGCAYIAVCGGKAYSTLENPEMFEDDKESLLPGKPELSEYSYVKEGTVFKDLTLSDASTEFYPRPSSVIGADEKDASDGRKNVYNISKTSAFFDGTVTLKGYITKSNSQSGYREMGEIDFFPADGEWEGMPFIWNGWGGHWGNDKFSVAMNAPSFYLGISDDYDLDLSAIPDDESAILAEVTLTDITLIGYDFNFGQSTNSARLVDFNA